MAVWPPAFSVPLHDRFSGDRGTTVRHILTRARSRCVIRDDVSNTYWPEQQPRSGGAEGSGCAPGSDQLPDGYWFGMVTAYSAEDITFDLACWFSDEDEPNGYRIRNDNAALRTIAVADGAEAWRIDLDFELGLAPPIPFSDWVPETANFIVCPGESCLVWIHTEGGVVCELVEQYTP